GVTWLGRKPLAEVYRLLGEASCMVIPSKWYEGLPRTVLESFAVGTPVIASDLGSLSCLIEPKETGFHFIPGDSASLAAAVQQFIAQADSTKARMRQTTRQEFELKYTATQNYHQLLKIYQEALL
ncbi:MAG: glycosyltransferase family 4 protein, partial [Phormidesmis sp.]